MADVDRDVVVLGGGPAGLAAAWRAARAGRSVLLLERAPAVGGMAGLVRGGRRAGGHGSHRLHPATPAPVLDPAARAARRRTCRPGRATAGCGCTTAGSASRCARPSWPGRCRRRRCCGSAGTPRAARSPAPTRPRTPSLLVSTLGPGALRRALRAVRGEAVGAARPGHRRRAGPPPGRQPAASGASPASWSAGTGPGRGGCSSTRAAASARSSTCSPRRRCAAGARSRPAPR